MSSSSCNSSRVMRNPSTFKLDLDGNIYCHHELLAVLRVVRRKSARNGQQFYGCSQWPKDDCKFFLWKEDVDNLLKDSNFKSQNLELQNRMLVDENKQLKENLQDAEAKLKRKWLYLCCLFLAVVTWLYS